ncbi:hypothetical protein FVO59_02570 [Microbacterium esteraromaticum]|uniref:Aminoglycoside phosphotransferase domain-containing protein n=1 Tax=Microbacterium esteraromaticum TaxID=57043 RepID=A0A7D7WCE1_9MICO|nr:hypothetical protein [Microbacterium esteraromaticum]QMU96212.1 hypothetical protein FVO59_02570 [Microbacterium esteraromaticum]
MAWTPEVWKSTAFEHELRDWISPHTGAVRALTRVKDHPWSGVWRVDAERGCFYVKQNCPGQQHEARIASVLSRIAPDFIVEPVALDEERDLLLTRDAGRTWREALAEGAAVGWEPLLHDAMLLARTSVPVVDDMRLTVLDPAGIRDHLVRTRDEWRIPEEFRAAADAAVEVVGAAGDQVAALGLPLALDHNDLHDANAFVGDHGARFFDFGDAVASSPLAVLRIPLAVYARSIHASENDPRVLAIADAALEVWSDLAPMAELRAALPAANRLAAVARAESWHRILESVPEEFVAEDYRRADAEWLAESAL